MNNPLASNRLIPIYRDQGALDNSACFVSAYEWPVQFIKTLSGLVPTTALKFGQMVNLLALGSADETLASGVPSVNSRLDSDIQLRSILIKMGDRCHEIDMAKMPGSVFTYSVDGVSRDKVLDMRYRVLCALVPIQLHLVGRFNLDTAIGQVDGVVLGSGSNIKLLGYYLKAYPVDFNIGYRTA